MKNYKILAFYHISSIVLSLIISFILDFDARKSLFLVEGFLGGLILINNESSDLPEKFPFYPKMYFVVYGIIMFYYTSALASVTFPFL